MPKMTPYEIVKAIITKNKIQSDEEFLKSFQPYIIVRYLSMDRRFFDHAVILNRYTFDYTSNDKKPMFFDLLWAYIPKSQPNIRYIKGQKQNSYPEGVYKIMRTIHGEHLSKSEINWIIRYMSNSNLKDELKQTLIQSGLDYAELKEYFPDLFTDNIQKVSTLTIKKEIDNITKRLKKEKEDKQKSILDELT